MANKPKQPNWPSKKEGMKSGIKRDVSPPKPKPGRGASIQPKPKV